MTTVAELNAEGHLIGFKKLKGKVKPKKADVVVPDDCDLATNGTYKWDPAAEAFIPLGHGFGRPKAPPISSDLVLYLITSERLNDFPQEVRDWCEWYENNMKRREEETQQRRGR